MRFWIDVEDSSGAKIGPGPIITGNFWRSVSRLDRAGEWRLEVPATDARSADLLTIKRRVRCYTMINGAATEIGGGEIEEVRVRIRANVDAILEVSGSDMLRELTRPTIANEEEYSESNSVPSTLISTYASSSILPASWSLAGRTTTNSNVSVKFIGESVLEGMIRVANAIGEHFRLDGTRSLRWLGSASDLTATWIVASTNVVPTDSESNPNVCHISNITHRSDGYELRNKAFPYGATAGGSRLSLLNATLWPDGTTIATNPHTIDGEEWEIDKANNWLRSNDSITEFGTFEKSLALSDVSSSSATNAANMLLRATFNWLRLRDDTEQFFDLSVVGLDTVLLPGDKLRIQARKFVDGEQPINIDEEVYILEAITEITERGVQTVNLSVATVDRWPETAESIILESAQSQDAQQAYAADTGISDHGALTGLADDDHTQYLNESRGDARYFQPTDTLDSLVLTDGITAPSSESGKAKIFVDSSDGDLKVIFGDGHTGTIAVDS